MYAQKPLICITNDSNNITKPEGPRQVQSPKAYSAAIFNAGGIPVVTSEFAPEELSEVCDGLLLSGGDDLEPSLYGEEILNPTVKPDPTRTEFELKLLKAFIAKKKPIMTICRGTQLVNVALGGALYQDLLEQCGYVHMNGEIRHYVYADEGSILHNLFGAQFKTNSTHHQAIRIPAPGIRVTARSIEGIVEAIEHETLPIFGTQFHPERLTGERYDGRTPDFAPLFKFFIDRVRNDINNR